MEVGSDDEHAEADATATDGSKESEPEPPSTSTTGSERAPSLPPRPRAQPTSPSLAPAFTTSAAESLSVPDPVSDRKSDTLTEIKEEAEGHEKAAGLDDVASVLSSSSRSTRFRMPSLRRRVTDSSSKQRSQSQGDNASYSTNSVSSSPRSISGAAGRRSRRTSEVTSEDDAASLERLMGLASASDRAESWGFGDEVVMGLD